MAGDHWIELVWAKDGAGRVVAAAKLSPSDAPSLTFAAPAGASSLTAFESCNLHGTWASEPTAL